MDDCEYRFRSLFSRFSSFPPFSFLSSFYRVRVAGPEAAWAGADSPAEADRDGGRPVPRWVGFAEATDRRTDGQTDSGSVINNNPAAVRRRRAAG